MTIMIAARTLILAGVAAVFLPGMAIAADSKNQGYLVDVYGNSITTSSNTGLCWHSSDWTPARSVEPCDPVARKAEAPAPKVAPPAPPPQKTVAVPVVPAPVVAAPPKPKIVRQNVSFSVDTMFAFDKAELRPKGKAMLDDFVKRQLSGTQYHTITVTGHTDRIGSSAYNQELSDRRADAVRDYLLSRNVPADRITAVGKGEVQPATAAGECKGPRGVKLIACLQPDRRVHIEMTGTKVLTTTGSQ
jgi:OmpA-OmpF porin, OOP family